MYTCVPREMDFVRKSINEENEVHCTLAQTYSGLSRLSPQHFLVGAHETCYTYILNNEQLSCKLFIKQLSATERKTIVVLTKLFGRFNSNEENFS